MLKNDEDIYCADDNYFSPIHLNDLCVVIKCLIKKNVDGIYHLSSPSKLNRKEMLKIVVLYYKRYGGNYLGNIIYKSLNEFKGAENQPLNTSLNPNKAIYTTGIEPKNFEYWVNVIMNGFINNLKN